MAKTESRMLPLGTSAPDFSLPEPLTDRTVSLYEVAGSKGTLVMFICNHCPFVKHLLDELVRLGHDYASTDIGLVAISSNDITGYPQDRPKKMAELAHDKGFAFPYLFDESQSTARACSAACTPDFFVFDDSRPGNNEPVTGGDVRAALNAMLEDQPVPRDQKPSIGCNIKWKG